MDGGTYEWGFGGHGLHGLWFPTLGVALASQSARSVGAAIGESKPRTGSGP
jgi:hypothetical protein